MTDEHDWEATAGVARRAAQAGGRIIASSFPTPDGTGVDHEPRLRIKDHKSYNLVTETDEASEAAIVAVIQDAFPDHAILAEEGHARTSDAEHLWIIDPLDGTNNFAHGIEHCAVSIAYRYRGATRVAVVHNPLRDDWYEARQGQGATWNGWPIHVTDAASLDEVLVGVGFYYDRGRMMQATLAAIGDLFAKQIHGIRRFGTAALDLCFVASGRFGAFFEYRLAPWDFAAGSLIVEEAGGVVTRADGRALTLDAGSVLAAPRAIYDQILPVIQARMHEFGL